jgi:hypothetical protein
MVSQGSEESFEGAKKRAEPALTNPFSSITIIFTSLHTPYDHLDQLIPVTSNSNSRKVIESAIFYIHTFAQHLTGFDADHAGHVLPFQLEGNWNQAAFSQRMESFGLAEMAGREQLQALGKELLKLASLVREVYGNEVVHQVALHQFQDREWSLEEAKQELE